jgi:peptidoglycan/LPS O-acetylase OafA/YrhL
MAFLPRAAPGPAALIDEWSAEPNLDLLRAIAVLCVVMRHLGGALELPTRWWFQPQALGIFGVLIFFVHTSLVLMVSLDRQWRKGGTSAPRLYGAFLVRRFFRIYPLSVTVILLLWFVVVPHGDPSARVAGILVDGGRGDLVTNLLLVHDLAGRKSVEAPLWSLPAEVQMYLLLPALFFIVRRRGARPIALLVWPIAVVVAIVCWKVDGRANIGRYAPCFVAGILCYGLLGARRSLPFILFPLTVLAALFADMIAYGRVGLQGGWGIIITGLLACLIPRFARMRGGVLRRASHTLAKYSYGIYLFHLPCMWFAFRKVHGLGPGGSAILALALVAVVSILGYQFIEAPLIRFGQGLAVRILERPQSGLAPAIATVADGGTGPGAQAPS